MAKEKLVKNEKTFSEKILGGRGELYLLGNRTPYYHLRIFLPEERKYIRKSTKSRDLDSARKIAERMVLEIHADLSAGKKFFGITLGELVERYLEYRWKDVEINNATMGQEGITKGRWGTIKSQLKHFLTIKSPELKLAELDRDSLYDWRTMRFDKTPNTSLITIRNEQATINAMFQYAFREGLSSIPKLNFAPIKIKKEQIGRRDTFTPAEYKKITEYFKTWCSGKECKDEKEKYYRETIRDFFLILSNTGMRFGELKQLTWEDIKGMEDTKDDRGWKIKLVQIHIRPETSKHRQTRYITSRGGEYFDRVRKRVEDNPQNPATNPDDFVFTSYEGQELPRRQMDAGWKDLMEKTGFANYKERKLQYYSLRHYAISLRLRNPDETIWSVANYAGTRSEFIEQHYGHILEDDKRASALRNVPFGDGNQFKAPAWDKR